MSRAADLQWAEPAAAGEYLAEYEDAETDPSSRCGRDDSTLDAIRRVLRGRGLRLVADDRGLCAAKGEEEAWAKIDAEHDTWVDHVRNREETP